LEKGGNFMKTFATVPRPARVRFRGQITIPQDIREDMNLDEQAAMNLFRVGKVLLLTPKRLERASLAKKIEREMKREGLTLEDLLADLKSQRKRYLEEAY
jgi:bifunctional DNA-binding transcriptional regulator/antitoxin component of YhaV-PrlF toxin-antitoxin module